MARKFEEIVAEMTQQGLDESYVSELSEAWSASPIRKERDAIAAERDALRDAVLNTKFEKFGVKVKPQALVRPADLDITDDDKVKGWLTDLGVIDQAPAADAAVDADLAAQGRIDTATAGAGSPAPNATFHEDIAKAQSPEEVMAILERNGMTSVQV